MKFDGEPNMECTHCGALQGQHLVLGDGDLTCPPKPREGVDVNAPCVGCFICGDKSDHHGRPHSEVMEDGLTRYDVSGPAIPYEDCP